MNISAIIIARNEESRIAKCLSSVAWVDERIVVDNGSTDGTREVAKKQGASAISAPETYDFSKLRNLGKKKASGEWLLYVDADEIVSEELVKEIKKVISFQSSAISGYELRRKNYYLGHPWPADEYILRLMRKDALIGWFGQLHETARIKGEIGRLSASLIHTTHRTREEMVAKTNEWSEVESKLRFDAGHPPIVWWRLLRVMTTAFWDSFIRQGGRKAGTIGWIESIYQAFSIFITYAKLWEMQDNPTNNPIRPISQ
ncbi:glycosyltransferase family 2 protein [Candidatus Gottesmanbacteria bacterium]|nr:glycosyltransferase family 2 protein [Candidatus Gottesmanbacteria bacterium]